MKPIQKKINGILLLDKPLKMSSNAALQRIKRLFNAKKAGHTGSLDPLATGMLPVCFGDATKFSQFLLDSSKHYEVEATLGVKTSTGDAEGEVIDRRPIVDVTEERVINILKKFHGEVKQIPPMHSAIKVQGQPLYKLARKGLEIPRLSRVIQIFSLRLKSITAETFIVEVHCSKGTYVRTLIEDIGEELHCGAYVSALRRTSVVPYEKNRMYTLSTLEELQDRYGTSALTETLLPIESSVQSLPSIKLSASAAFYLRMGQPVMVPHLPLEGCVRLYIENSFIGVGEVLEDGRVAPRRLVELQKSNSLKSQGLIEAEPSL